MNAAQRPTPRHDWSRTADSWREPARESQTPARVISSAVLFNGAGEIIIEHAGGQYRLKITRQNKLILNK